MATRTKTRKHPADSVVVALETVAGEQRVIARGDRLRGDDPFVVANPHLFVRDGATTEERAVLLAELSGETQPYTDPMQVAQEAIARPPRVIPEDTKLADLWICVLGFGTIGGWDHDGCHEGVIVTSDDPRLAAMPAAFRPLREQIG